MEFLTFVKLHVLYQVRAIFLCSNMSPVSIEEKKPTHLFESH